MAEIKADGACESASEAAHTFMCARVEVHKHHKFESFDVSDIIAVEAHGPLFHLSMAECKRAGSLTRKADVSV
jgi:hypothetical protein